MLVQARLDALQVNTDLNRGGESVVHDVSLTGFERLRQQFTRRCCLGRTEFGSSELLLCCGTDQPHGS